MDTEKNKNKAGITQVGQFGIDTTLIQEDQGRAVEQWNKFTGVINKSQFLLNNRHDPNKELSRAQLIKDSEQVLKLIEQLVPNIQTLVQEYKESHKEHREARDAQLN